MKRLIFALALTFISIASPVFAQFNNPGNIAYTSLRTPASFGLNIDNTNNLDVTTILNTFVNDCIGTSCYLPCGIYKTSGEIIASGSGAATLTLQGGGPQCTIIAPTNNNFNGVRIALGDNLSPKGSISNIGVNCLINGCTLPTLPNNKAGFMCDGTTIFEYHNVSVSGFDVGYDFINNCYNFHGYSLNSPRFATNNVGINLREGSQSGSDMHFYGTYLYPSLYAVVMKGNAGGFHFFGGQWETLKTSSTFSNLSWTTGTVTATTTIPHGIPVGQTAIVPVSGAVPSGYNGTYTVTATGISTFTYALVSNPGTETSPGTFLGGDARGVIQLGYDYVNSSIGGSVSATSFNGISIEGFLANWTVRSWAPLLGVQFYGFSINASDNTANQALGIWNMTNGGNSTVSWINGSVAQSHFANAAVASLSFGGGMQIFESGWSSVQGTTLNGASQGDQWLTTLAFIAQGSTFGGNFKIGNGFYTDGSVQEPWWIIGGGAIRYHQGVLQRTTTGTWTTF